MAPIAPPPVDYRCNYEKNVLHFSDSRVKWCHEKMFIFILLAGGSVLGGCEFSTGIVGFVVSLSSIVVFCIVGFGVVRTGIEWPGVEISGVVDFVDIESGVVFSTVASSLNIYWIFKWSWF